MAVQKIFNALLANLTTRQNEIVSGRFGVGRASKPETLQVIGKRLGITRERVRQIEHSALHALEKHIAANTECTALLASYKKHLKASGGVLRKEKLLETQDAVAQGLTENHLALLLEASNAFFFYPEDKDFWAFYYLDKPSLKRAASFVEEWASILRSKKKEVLEGRYHEYLKSFMVSRHIPKNFADNYLGISKKVHANPFGDVGLREWTEIRPLTIRDRIYLVLKKKHEPLHFQTIAEAINAAGFDSHKALAPTVHNELIKDDRFVLVGRGIYALCEDGYEPGTAREVIKRILMKKGPLPPKEILVHVQKERFFKPNTVLINLQNKNIFSRLPDGRYHVKEA